MTNLASMLRLWHIAAVVTRHALAYGLSALLARWSKLALHLSLSIPSGPDRLRAVFQDLGGTFIKLGQMLALQPGILPIAYCNALFDLLDRCVPFDYAYVEQTFTEETGNTPSEIFDFVDVRPLATASIGQVHVGHLRGRKVAIKVQRPSVETDFAGDIRLVLAALKVIKVLRLRFLYWVVEPLTEFVAWTREELDYRCEARYMDQLRRNAQNNSNERIPEVFWEYTTRRILVTEFLEGDTVLSYIRARENNDELMLHRLKTSGFDETEVARHIIDNFLGDAFQHGIFHADLHPANLLILPHNVVGYCDMGITGVISAFARRHLVAVTLAYTRGDLDAMCDGFFKVSAIRSDLDAQRFRDGLKQLADTWYETTGTGRRLRKSFTMVMLDMLRLSRDTGVSPERDVIKYIRSSVAIDGLITRFAPGFDVGEHLEAVCHSYLKWQGRKSLLTYNTLVGWASASEHLMRDGPFRFSNLLHRLAKGEPAGGHLDGSGRQPDKDLQWKPAQLGALVLALSLIMTSRGEAVHLGVNLFTAEVLLIASAAVMLLRTAVRFSAD